MEEEGRIVMQLREELTGIVGPENVFDDQETLDAYARDESFAKPLKPWALAKPANNEEVQAIVQWANKRATPLVPVSSGPPHYRGDTVPSLPGAVIVDLVRMKEIITIDRRNKLAIVEPGVTWAELIPELTKKGLTISMPLLPRRSKSVIGSLLEREPNTIPKYNWTLLEPLRCCNVIWGNGEEMWTGEAGDQKGSLEDRWGQFLYQVNPMGPHQTDFYRLLSAAQGTMGIVTRASVKCELKPQIHKLFFVQSEKLNDLIEFSYKVLRARYGHELFILNSFNFASIIGDENVHIAKNRDHLTRWILIIGVAGFDILPRERIAFQEKDISDMARQCGQRLTAEIPGHEGTPMLEILNGPLNDPYWKSRYKGAHHDIFFVTTLDRTVDFVNSFSVFSQENGFSTADMGIYIQPLMQGVACHCEFVLPFAPENSRETSIVKKLVADGSQALMNQGAFFSRPYGTWANMVYSKDAQTTEVLKKVKSIFDPNHVMNPGKLCL